MDYSYISKLLSLPDDGSISIDNVEVAGDTKYVYISRPPIPTYCPNCSCRMLLKASIREKSNTLFYRILPALSLSLARESGNALTVRLMSMNLILSSSHINNLLILHLCSSWKL